MAQVVGEVRLNEFLTSLSLQHLAPILAEEDLTYELLESMQGEDFASEICELGISSEDAERLEAALLVATSTTAPANPTPAPATNPSPAPANPMPAPTAASSQAPPALPITSSDRHAAVTAALEKATGVSQSSALAAALALVGKPTAVSASSIVAYEPPVLPSAQAMIDARAPSTAPKGPATKNAALKRYQDRYIDPSTRAILEQDRKWRDEAAAEARYRDRHANPLSWNRNDI